MILKVMSALERPVGTPLLFEMKLSGECSLMGTHTSRIIEFYEESKFHEEFPRGNALWFEMKLCGIRNFDQ